MSSEPFRVASWNVNSIRRRLDAVLAWLGHNPVDVLVLQETKTIDDQFPAQALEESGYRSAVWGESQRNGVALLARHPIDDVTKGLDDEQDDQARYIEGTVRGFRVASLYLPNGTAPDSPNFTYKLGYFERLRARLERALENEESLIIAGDYNVAPAPVDVYDAEDCEDDVCFRPEVWAGWRGLLNQGFYDGFRAAHTDRRAYTWWPHQGRGFELDEGMRIDHLLCAPAVIDRLVESDIDPSPRGEKNASDHVPIWCSFRR
ncbi:MAG: exodeoxyribonuclease III [Geminicoccaceae bacterium]